MIINNLIFWGYLRRRKLWIGQHFLAKLKNLSSKPAVHIAQCSKLRKIQICGIRF